MVINDNDNHHQPIKHHISYYWLLRTGSYEERQGRNISIVWLVQMNDAVKVFTQPLLIESMHYLLHLPFMKHDTEQKIKNSFKSIMCVFVFNDSWFFIPEIQIWINVLPYNAMAVESVVAIIC